MIEKTSTSAAISALKHEFSSSLSKQELEALGQRINYLERLNSFERRDNRLIKPTVFLSFAGKLSESMIQDVYPEIRKLTTPDTGERFEVNTGMSREGKPMVMDHIIEKMESCCIFLGILTKEHRLYEGDDDGNNHTPGAWVILEAGIAIGLGLRVIFLVENGIHESFWYNPLGSWRHAMFERENYRSGLAGAKNLILEHYRNLRSLQT